MGRPPVEELIGRAHAHGVTLWVEQEALRFRARPGALPAELRADLSARKTEIVAFLKSAGPGTPAPIPAAPRDASFPLSFAQERLWFLDQLSNDGAYWEAAAVLLTGTLDVEALEASLSSIVDRHEILRSIVVEEDGEPRLRVLPPSRVRVPIVDLSAETESAFADAVRALARRGDADHGNAPLRVRLVRVRNHADGRPRHVLLSAIHHMYVDMWSMAIFTRELSEGYAACAQGERPAFEPLPVQYADYAAWQRTWLTDAALTTQLDYWRRRLADIPPRLTIPTDEPRPALYRFVGASLPVTIANELTDGLRRICTRSGATLFMGLLAAFAIVLSRYSGQTDVVIGSPTANRRRREIEGLIGFFANTLALRVDVRHEERFEELMRRLAPEILEDFERQDVPFEKVVEAVQPRRDPSHSPVFQVMLVLQNAPAGEVALPGLTVSPFPLDEHRSRFDFTLELTEGTDGLSGRIEFNTTLFHERTIRQLVDHVGEVIAQVGREPSMRVDDIELSSQPATRAPNVHAPPPLLHELVEAFARRTPDAPAVNFQGARLTYAALNRDANRLARHLRERGVTHESIVGIALHRSPDVIVSMLAALKAGAAFLPLDPLYPSLRTAWMIEDARPRVVITTSDLDEARASVAANDGSDLNLEVSPSQLAYVIYTSGTTGSPKGVLIEHAGLAHLAREFREILRADGSSRLLQFASMNFDAFVAEMATAFASGGALHLAGSDRVMPGPELQRLLEAERITHAILPPTALAMLAPDGLDHVSTIMVAGETCPPALAHRWAAGRRFLNGYGPTEASVCATVFEHDGNPDAFPIGRPLAHTTIEILDDRGRRVPAGVVGEMHVGGAGVGRGYLNQPALTAEKFVLGPEGERLYKTGDLGRVRHDGAIEYAGRIDHQVKIRGVRIELGEIEATLAEHPAVGECAVVTLATKGDTGLVACWVARDGVADVAPLRRFLSDRLPPTMVPSAFVPFDRLPQTPTGKVDRRALLEGVTARLASTERASSRLILPRNARELRLAEIWQDLLNVFPVSVDRDFFEVGGHSYLAVKLVSTINAAFGSSLPLSTIFQHPTIEKLAFALRDRAVAWSPLVPLQPRGDEAPLFCVHPAGGAVFCYVKLAPLIGFNRPVYGVQERGIERGAEPYASIDEMAAAYADAIVRLRPEGPYRLVGWSSGGTVAFEIARRLEAHGHQVSTLIMIDTPAPGGTSYEQDDVAFLVERLQPGGIALADLHRYQTREAKVAYVFEEIRRSLPETLVFDTEDALRFLALHKHHNRITSEYVPSGPIAANVAYIKADGAISFDTHMGQPLEAWPAFAGGFIAETVPGNHFNLFDPPYLDGLAATINALLATPQSPTGSRRAEPFDAR